MASSKILKLKVHENVKVEDTLAFVVWEHGNSDAKKPSFTFAPERTMGVAFRWVTVLPRAPGMGAPHLLQALTNGLTFSVVAF